MIYRDEATGSSRILISDLSVKLSLYKRKLAPSPSGSQGLWAALASWGRVSEGWANALPPQVCLPLQQRQD